MTERKPPGVSHETWVDAQVRAAQERGDFDDLPGMGKPIPGDAEPDDEMWWIKGYLRREGVPTETMLPEPLKLRREVDRLPEKVRELPTEAAVRDVVGELNERIGNWLRSPTGPAIALRLVNADRVVQLWRAAHPPEPTEPAAPTPPPAPSRPWWRRLLRRRD